MQLVNDINQGNRPRRTQPTGTPSIRTGGAVRKTAARARPLQEASVPTATARPRATALVPAPAPPPAPAVRFLSIDEGSAGQRIDNFLLRELKGVPKSHIYRILRSGEVRVDGGRAKPEHKLAAGQTVRLPPVRVAARDDTSPALPRDFPVLFEDAQLLIVDKPAGVAVHGGSGISHGLIEQVRAARPELRDLELVHRLDRETSGVLLLAKKRSALRRLHDELRDGATDKHYLALVSGKWRDDKRAVKAPLLKYVAGDGERRVRVATEGQPSETVFRLLRRWPQACLLDCELLTGRTHQIRVHLLHTGHPIAGDDKYGDYDWNHELARMGLKRMFLHAARMSFTHPATGETMTVEAPLPAALVDFVGRLDLPAGPARTDAALQAAASEPAAAPRRRSPTGDR
ncbi:MAG: 23S rRNA pseudouridine(955/2504/2580) synthase RluC [Betaproteobacteria bacterium]|nr:23S rRNA pseudouridine(955/2504/2580) synthase RluC [Betaproteobacteria bacterium]